MKNLIFFFLILFATQLYAQRKIHFEGKAGMIFPASKEFGKVYNQGFTVQAGCPIEIKKPFYLSPYLTAAHLVNKPIDGIKETFTSYELGLGIRGQFSLEAFENIKLLGALRLGFNHYTNNYELKYPAIPRQEAFDQNIFRGYALSESLVVGIIYKKLSFELSYHLLSDKPSLDKVIQEGIEIDYGLYQLYRVADISRLSFNSIKIQVGILL